MEKNKMKKCVANSSLIRSLRYAENLNRYVEWGQNDGTYLGISDYSYLIRGDMLRIKCNIVSKKLDLRSLRYVIRSYESFLRYFNIDSGEFELDVVNKRVLMCFNIHQYLLGNDLPF